MTFHLPWKIKRLPRAVPRALALGFLTLAILKLNAGDPACQNPWRAANFVMTYLELFLAALLWTTVRREFGALLGCAAMMGAAALLTWAHWTGLDVRGCGCFGSIQAPYGVHMVLCGLLFATCFVVLISIQDAKNASMSAIS